MEEAAEQELGLLFLHDAELIILHVTTLSMDRLS